MESESPVFGYREFFYDNFPNALRGLYGQLWKGAEMEAQCLCEGERSGDRCPVDKPYHRCGIYLCRQPVSSRSAYVGAFCVGWGKVIEHEEGWRVQFCRIERLVLPPEPTSNLVVAIPSLKSRYGVPIETSDGRPAEVTCRLCDNFADVIYSRGFAHDPSVPGVPAEKRIPLCHSCLFKWIRTFTEESPKKGVARRRRQGHAS
jgi:hypothetical protein